MNTETTIDSKPRVVMERLVRLEDADRSFDIEFWQRQGSNIRGGLGDGGPRA